MDKALLGLNEFIKSKIKEYGVTNVHVEIRMFPSKDYKADVIQIRAVNCNDGSTAHVEIDMDTLKDAVESYNDNNINHILDKILTDVTSN